ncbi:MAG: SpoIID/LytB domain-containing protein [Chitinispirillaceae bacterium]|nr:SpoIID/LytB domain-containing protein [Chitinispirillaceae bacterium]
MENSKNWRKREVLTDKKCCRYLAALLIIPVFISCSTPWIRANPPSLQQHGTDTTTAAPSPASVDSVKEINFADAFDASISLPDEIAESDSIPGSAITTASRRSEPFSVPTNRVRVALVQNTGRLVVYSVGAVRLHTARQPYSDGYRGRMLIEARKGNRIRLTAGFRPVEAALPCTLLSDQAYNFIEIGDNTYRGALIVTSGKPGTFTAVNYLEVEEYLRGVVPLELGRHSPEEIEALKAQAVAARTYTYRRIIERKEQPFDLVATVADQVYGGVDVEYREADKAIKATRNTILTYGDSIILAYYHSTCGGTTSDVHQVWRKPAEPYLRSVSDLDGSGKAWCRASAYFTWEESWPWKQFSAIVVSNLQRQFSKHFKGVVNSISVDDRFPCGRVSRLTITGSGWAQECGGDQVRFIIRRGIAGHPILRSANFSVVPSGRSVIKITGKGYGHGVGMCQMGAIGRAQAGQDFQTILQAYYSGVTFSVISAGADAR